MAEGYKDFIAGTVGGFSGKLLDYPFDTVKVLLQTQNSLSPASTTTASTSQQLSSTIQSTATAAATPQNMSKIKPISPLAPPPPVYRGAMHCLSHTIETRGFMSLYQGLSSPLVGSMAENAVLFLSYGEVKRMLGEKPGENKELSLLQLATAGGVAGAIVSFVLNPFEVIKVQMQVMNSAATAASTTANAAAGVSTKKYNGVMDCVLKTIRNEGIVKGLYRGQTSLLLREIPGNFCWYGVYEGVCLTQIPEGGTKRD
ncbi:hypothetical protein ACHAXR_005808, partial [Thalassiosira sp. AJA248-18]